MRRVWAAFVALMVFGTVAVLYLLVPRLEARWADFGVQLSPPLRVLIQASHFAVEYAMVFLSLAAGLLAWAFWPQRPSPPPRSG
jgi:type II secretory pathway component PulF